MADEELAPPIEIPWKLASTTQVFEAGGPVETTISLFFHEPDEETLTDSEADDKLVYFKVTASVSPCRFEPTDSELASAFLAGNLPVLHLQLDLDVSPASGETGSIRPYFHGAQPLHRRFIETGVVGNDLVEGASDGQFFGKSGSQLYESVDSSSRTTSFGGGASFTIPFTSIGVGASAQTTGTDVSSTRNVDQMVDTTTREASQERRELVSHTTNVENVITLLTAKHLGTPYLRFSLFPRPLQLLSIDPSDPNLWFSQLLRQRSSGIEGIQEFTAVVVVPRDMDFCVNARLRRVCLLDDPPGPPNFNESFTPDFFQLARMARYIYDLFPKGTPLDELDIDLVSQLTPAKDFRRPVVRLWAFRLGSQVIEAIVASPGDAAGLAEAANVNYKHMLEVWLETLRAEYEQELRRSPLERGAVLGENRALNTCFAAGEDGSLSVSSSSRSVTPLVPIDLDFTVDAEIADLEVATSVRSRALQTITRWNAIERRLNAFLTDLDDVPDGGSPLEAKRVASVLIARLAKIAPEDERNLPLDEAVKMLGLSADHKRRLGEAGARDLRGIAQALAAAPAIDLQNAETERFREEYAADKGNALTRRRPLIAPPDSIEFPLSESNVTDIRNAVAKALRGGYKPPPRRPKKNPTRRRK